MSTERDVKPYSTRR